MPAGEQARLQWAAQTTRDGGFLLDAIDADPDASWLGNLPQVGALRRARVRWARRWFTAVSATAAMVILVGVAGTPAAWAAQPPVGLGTTTSFAVLAGTTVTNTGPSVISGNLGVSPGTAVTGFPPGKVINGTQHKADAVALQAQSDLTTAYTDAAGRTPATVVSKDLGGQTLAPGVYKAASAMGLTGTVTLDGHSDPNAVFIFQAGSTLITASSSTVKLIGGAQACNVFWQVGSSATLGPHHLRWKHPGVDLGDGADQNHRGRTGVGPKRSSQPGHQHHYTTDVRYPDPHTIAHHTIADQHDTAD